MTDEVGQDSCHHVLVRAQNRSLPAGLRHQVEGRREAASRPDGLNAPPRGTPAAPVRRRCRRSEAWGLTEPARFRTSIPMQPATWQRARLFQAGGAPLSSVRPPSLRWTAWAPRTSRSIFSRSGTGPRSSCSWSCVPSATIGGRSRGSVTVRSAAGSESHRTASTSSLAVKCPDSAAAAQYRIVLILFLLSSYRMPG